MRVIIVPVTPFQQNCSILICEKTNEAAIVDPGGDIDHILEAVKKESVTVVKILLTHGHLDHCGATREISKLLKVPVEGPHVDDQFWIDQLAEQSRQFGFPASESFTSDRYLTDEDTITFGDIELEVKHCPGHTPGHVIFQGSIGRTDFPKGDHQTLISSIVNQLWPLGDDVTFIPGHGPNSTFGQERQNNPFVADSILNG